MVAKLISPDGEVFEISDALYQEVRMKIDMDQRQIREAQSQRFLEVLDWLKDDSNKESDEWWDEFNQFLAENRVHFPCLRYRL